MNRQPALQLERLILGLCCVLSACVSESPGNGGASNFVSCSSDDECPSGRCSARNLCVEESAQTTPDAGDVKPSTMDPPVQPSPSGGNDSGVAPEPAPTETPPVEPEPPRLRPVCEGHYDIQDQAELDTLYGCQAIEGSLLLEPPEGVEFDLEPLSTIESVSGLLAVGVNQWSAFDSLEGLRSVRSAGMVSITNTRAETLEGLRNLERITGLGDEPDSATLDVFGNANLVDLAGLANLRAFGSLMLNSNPLLTSLDGLVVPEKLELVYIVNLESLTSLTALAPLREVGSLRVTRLASLETLEGLTELERASELTLSVNPALVAVAPLSSLTECVHVDIEDNDSLQRLDFLPAVPSLDTVSIWRNDSLTTLEFPELAEIESLTIVRNTELDPEVANSFVEQLTTLGSGKIAGNSGETELLSPCPWANDSTCDEPEGLDVCEVGTDPECLSAFE